MSTADVIAKSARMGWMPSYPTFDRNPLDLADEAAAAGRPVAEHVVDQLRSGDLRFAAEDPDSPENFPRVLAIWRANLLGSSGKGNEYFLKHLLGTDSSLRADRGVGEPAAAGGGVARRARPRASSTCCSPWTSGRPAPRSSPTSCCPPRPGTRSTTSTPPTCTRSCTRSTRRSRRRGRPAPTGTPGRRSRRSSASWPPGASAPARTWSRSRCCTTPPTRWPTRTAWSATGSTASASRSRA